LLAVALLAWWLLLIAAFLGWRRVAGDAVARPRLTISAIAPAGVFAAGQST
jgi:hypothetical protein